MKKFIKILVLISVIISTILLISDVDIDIEFDTGKSTTYAYHEGGSSRTSDNELIAKPPSASYDQIYQWAVNNNASDLYLEVLPIIWEKLRTATVWWRSAESARSPQRFAHRR